MGIRMAPLVLPLHRRLETFACLMATSAFFLFVLLLLFCLMTPITYPVLVPYMIWIYYDDCVEHGGRRSDWIRRARIWRWLRDYFPSKLRKEQDLDPARNYIFGYHPHGIIGTGLWINFCTEANNVSAMFPGVRITPVTLQGNLRVPFWRDFLLAHGLCSVSKQSFRSILTTGPGNSVIVVPGGAREALDAHPGYNDLTLRKRKGFIKMAMLHGADLVPVFSFGENEIFRQVDNSPGTSVRRWQQFFLQNVGVAPCMPYGRGIFNYSFGLLPQRKPITTIVGRPIAVTKNENPTIEEIDAVQEKYIAELQRIYNAHKDEYAADRKEDLRIVR